MKISLGGQEEIPSGYGWGKNETQAYRILSPTDPSVTPLNRIADALEKLIPLLINIANPLVEVKNPEHEWIPIRSGDMAILKKSLFYEFKFGDKSTQVIMGMSNTTQANLYVSNDAGFYTVAYREHVLHEI